MQYSCSYRLQFFLSSINENTMLKIRADYNNIFPYTFLIIQL